MNKETFLKRKGKIEKEAKEKMNKLYKEYADTNNPYKVGDVIYDNIQQCGKIEKIGYVVSYDKTCYCRYICQQLRKRDLRPYKSNQKCVIYQMNIKED